MKKGLFFILVFFTTLSTYADCASSGLFAFPSSSTVSKNSIFILSGYAHSQAIILGLNEQHNIYLKSNFKKVKLIVTEVCVGQYALTQAVLKPETELEAGCEYTMEIDNLPETRSFQKYNSATGNYESVTYRVTTERDTVTPYLQSQPKLVDKTYVSYGCGPAVYAIFDNPAKDNSPILAKTTVKSLKSGKETTYYIEPDGNTLKVGHGMCSGAFTFDAGEAYEIEFSFMDASGNTLNWIGERIKFTCPTPQNISSEK
jgi:hypothetical protein